MNRLIAKTIGTAALCAACGCFNMVVRPQVDVNQGLYTYTDMDQKAISKGWNGTKGGPASMLLPVFLVDWPFEVACDTVFLPWDCVMGGSRGLFGSQAHAPAKKAKPEYPKEIETSTFELNY